jgi:hypothetical protein
MPGYAIAVHGGCGRWDGRDTRAALRGVRAAVEAAHRVLTGGGSAVDAVCAAVVVLEDDPLFNAGTGSTLNREGDAEMDASVMVGERLRCGGVAAIRRVRNPILVARRVMEETPHVLLAGRGATLFARSCGFRDYDPVTRKSRLRLRGALAAAAGTVGAVSRPRPRPAARPSSSPAASATRRFQARATTRRRSRPPRRPAGASSSCARRSRSRCATASRRAAARPALRRRRCDGCRSSAAKAWA